MIIKGKEYFNNCPQSVVIAMNQRPVMAKNLETMAATGRKHVARNPNSATAGPRGPL
jgi:hypothetical protein